MELGWKLWRFDEFSTLDEPSCFRILNNRELVGTPQDLDQALRRLGIAGICMYRQRARWTSTACLCSILSLSPLGRTVSSSRDALQANLAKFPQKISLDVPKILPISAVIPTQVCMKYCHHSKLVRSSSSFRRAGFSTTSIPGPIGCACRLDSGKI